ncbi:MAG: hypothetical protein WB565_18315 [Acidimicrobiales bacterium]
MEPIDYLGALRRSWRLFIALGILGAVVAVLIPVSPKAAKGSLTGFKWSAVTTVGASPGGAQGVLGGGVTNTQVEFYAASTAVRGATLHAFGLSSTSGMMALMLSARPLGAVTKRGVQTSPAVLAAQGNTPYAAITLVTIYEKELGDYLVNLASQKPTRGGSGADVTTQSIGYQVLNSPSPVLNRAVKKSSITSSKKVRGLVGLAVGLLLAALIVLVRELLDKRIRSRERAESTFGYPVIAEIPGDAKSVSKRPRDLDVVGEPESVGAEAYRMLRMSVLFEPLAPKAVQSTGIDALLASGMGMGLGSPVPTGGNGRSTPSPNGGAVDEAVGSPTQGLGKRQVVLVISAGTEPSRPQVAANFAAVYAEAGQRAVVISTAELGTGRQGVPTGAVTGEIRPEDIESRLESSRIENVFRLPLSDFVENSGQLVTRAPAVIAAARPVADVIVVEAPPLLAVHHAEALSHAVDVALLVGECWETTYDDARRAGELLRRMEAPILGVVLTNVRISRHDIRHAHTSPLGVPGQEVQPNPDPNPDPVADLSPTAAATQSQA